MTTTPCSSTFTLSTSSSFQANTPILILSSLLETSKSFSYILETNTHSPQKYFQIYKSTLSRLLSFDIFFSGVSHSTHNSISLQSIYYIIDSIQHRSYIKIYLLPIIGSIISLENPNTLQQVLDRQKHLLNNIAYPLAEFFARTFSFDKYEKSLNKYNDHKIALNYKVNNFLRLLDLYSKCLINYKKNKEVKSYREMKTYDYIIIHHLNSICNVCDTYENKGYFIKVLLDEIYSTSLKLYNEYIMNWIVNEIPIEIMLDFLESIIDKMLDLHDKDKDITKKMFLLIERFNTNKTNTNNINENNDNTSCASFNKDKKFKVNIFVSIIEKIITTIKEVTCTNIIELKEHLQRILILLMFIKEYKPSHKDFDCFKYYQILIECFEIFITLVNTKNDSNIEINEISSQYDLLLEIMFSENIHVFKNKPLISITNHFNIPSMQKYNLTLLTYINTQSLEIINTKAKIDILITLIKNVCHSIPEPSSVNLIYITLSKTISNIYSPNIETLLSLFIMFKNIFINSNSFLIETCLCPYLSTLIQIIQTIEFSYSYKHNYILNNQLTTSQTKTQVEYDITSYNNDSMYTYLKGIIMIIRDTINSDYLEYAEVITVYLIKCLKVCGGFSFMINAFEETCWDLICVFRNLIETEISDLEIKVELIKEFISVLNDMTILSFEHYKEIAIYVSDEVKKHILKREGSAIVVLLSVDLFDRNHYGYVDKERIKRNIIYAEKEYALLVTQKKDFRLIKKILEKKIYYFFKIQGLFDVSEIYEIQKKIIDVCDGDDDDEEDEEMIKQRKVIDIIMADFEKKLTVKEMF